MGAEMRRRGSSWFVRHISAVFLLLSRSARAADDSVTIACDALTTDEAAELDARTRSTLLADGPEGAHVRVRCEAELATVLAVIGEQSESAVVRLPNAALKEALLAAVDRTLASAKEHARGTNPTSPSESVPEPPPIPTLPAANPPPPATAAPAPRANLAAVPVPSPPPTRAVRVAAGALVEPWDGKSAFGGRARVEVAFQPWSLALALGGFTSAERAESFVPTEWHALAVGALELEALANLRVSGAAGVSVLLAAPRSGLANASGTSITTALFELGLSRAFRFGRFALTPELDLRLFSGRREVFVDGTAQLSLPVASPLVALSVAYEL